jgi:two-component system response regulator (stage 0 sporulation protein F)
MCVRYKSSLQPRPRLDFVLNLIYSITTQGFFIMNKILLIDDEEGIHFVYRGELEDMGYEVHSALTGNDALRKLKNVSPDLVILDINMPGVNGIEVLRQIKETNPEMPVILCSAYQEYKQDLGAWASDDFILKSADLNDLKAAVRQHLS